MAAVNVFNATPVFVNSAKTEGRMPASIQAFCRLGVAGHGADQDSASDSEAAGLHWLDLTRN